MSRYVLALLALTSCASVHYNNSGVAVPIMLGPIDRIGGKSSASSGPTTIDAVMYEERGWSRSADIYALGLAVNGQVAAEHVRPQAATARIDEIAVGDYMMWSIPYLTPILLIRHSRVNPRGRIQVEAGQP